MPGTFTKWEVVTALAVTTLLAVACESGGTGNGPPSPTAAAAGTSQADSALCQDVAALRTSVSNLVNIHASGNTVASVREDMNDVLAKLSALRQTAHGTWNPQLSMLQAALTQLEVQVKGLASETGSASGVAQALGRVGTSAQRLFEATRTRCPHP